MSLKHKFQKYLNSNDLVLVLALFIAGALVWNTVGAMQRNYRLQQKYERLSAEVELLEIENKNLQYQIAYLKTDSFLEIASRDKFNKAASGETLLLLPGSGEDKRQAVAKSPEVTKKIAKMGWRGNLEAWWQFLSGNKEAEN